MGGKKNRFQWQILGLIFALSINAESNTLDLSLKNHKEHFEKIALNLQTFHTQSLQLVMAAKFLVVRALRSGGNNVL